MIDRELLLPSQAPCTLPEEAIVPDAGEPRARVFPPDYTKVPGSDRMRTSVQHYLEHGFYPGNFLTAVITNDLRGAFAHADDDNAAVMRDWVRFFYNEAQGNAWGSVEIMTDWMHNFDADGNVKMKEADHDTV